MRIVDSHAISHSGKVRDHNEDSVLAAPELGLWLVADGMGGHAAGEVASAITAATVKQGVEDGKTLGTAIMQAHEQVVAQAESKQENQGMGTTVVAARANDSSIKISWVGDSRCYRYRAHKLEQLTTDHSYLELLVQQGGLKREEARDHPQRHVVTQCIGMEQPAPDTISFEPQPGDYLLLCSDGLNDELTDAEIGAVFEEAATAGGKGSCQSIAEALLAKTLQTKARDNISIIVLKIGNPSLMHRINWSLWLPVLLGIGGGAAFFVLLLALNQ